MQLVRSKQHNNLSFDLMKFQGDQTLTAPKHGDLEIEQESNSKHIYDTTIKESVSYTFVNADLEVKCKGCDETIIKGDDSD